MGAHLSRSKRMPTAADDTQVLHGSDSPAMDEPESSVQMTRHRQGSGGAEPVTLVVYGWSNVAPGTMAWTFPTLQSALAAARTMKNATRWAVVSGTDPVLDVDDARATGRVLVETLPNEWLRLG
jgi:hypothetical protein